MRTVTQIVRVYKFNELDGDAQDRAINGEVDFIIETTDFNKLSKNSNLYKAYKRCSELKTPWFLGSYIMEHCENMVMKQVRQREYLVDGDVFVEE